jgi:uncharacterized membrane protein YeiH
VTGAATLAVAAVAQTASGETLSAALGIVQPALEYAGTVAFAVSGALLAARKRMDLVGVMVLGSIVAVGGGTTRDLLLQRPVFWVTSPTFVVVAAVVAMMALPLHRWGVIQWGERYNLINISDAAGMALFVITGTNVALQAQASPVAAVLIGVIAGVGGGIIRDVLAMQIPDVLRNGQFYASAAFIGAVLYALLLQLPVSPLAVFWLPILVIFTIRMASLRGGWGVPTMSLTERRPPSGGDPARP